MHESICNNYTYFDILMSHASDIHYDILLFKIEKREKLNIQRSSYSSNIMNRLKHEWWIRGK